MVPFLDGLISVTRMWSEKGLKKLQTGYWILQWISGPDVKNALKKSYLRANEGFYLVVGGGDRMPRRGQNTTLL